MANESTLKGNRKNTAIANENPINNGATGAAAPGASVTTAKGIIDLLSNLDTPSHLDAAGQAYIETIKTDLDKSGMGCNFHRITGSNYEACVIEKSNIGIALVFAKSYQNTNDLPPAAVRMDISQKLQLINAAVRIDQCIVVTEADYARAEKMASFIKNELNCQLNPNFVDITVNAFRGGQFVASMDMNAVKNYIEPRSPHAVPARADVGIVLYSQTQKSQVPGLGGRPEVERHGVLAVTGYTTFYMAPQVNMIGMTPSFGSVKYLPMFVITDIVSDLKSPAIVAAAISLAIEGFIVKQGWVSQFNNFAKNSPNVGRLIKDEQGNPWFAKDMAQRNEFFQNYLTTMQPMLAVDVQEGRAHIGCLNDFIGNPDNFTAMIKSFVNGGPDFAEKVGKPFVSCYRNFDGIVTKPDQTVVDSRSIDFLSLACDITDTNQLAGFLQMPQDSRLTLNNIKKHYPTSTEALYVTYRAIVSPAFFSTVAANLAGAMNMTYEYSNDTQIFDLSGIAQNYSFTTFGGLAQGGFGNTAGWNPQTPYVF